MNGIQSSLYTVAIALCVFSMGLLKDKKIRTSAPSVYFTGFLIIEALCFVFEVLMAHPATPLKALWLGLRMGLSLLVAPCLWLAIKESVEGVRPRVSALGRGHFAWVLAGAVLTLPLIETAHLGTDYYNPARVVSAMHSRVIHTTMLLCIAIFAVRVPVYLWRCRQLLFGPAARAKRASDGGSAPAITSWLHVPLALLFTTWVLGVLRTVQCATHAPQEFGFLFAFIEVSVAVGAIYTIVRRAAMPSDLRPIAPDIETNFRAPEIPAPVQHLVVAPEPVAVPVSASVAIATVAAAKYAKCRLDNPVRARIRRKLEAAMSVDALYCDSLLSLPSLSRAIKENAHYVSQVINEDLGCSFYEFVSRHRIEQAKKLLVDAPDETVLEIALAVGFNSKSTFNAAFRRNVGMTPSEYRAAQNPSRSV